MKGKQNELPTLRNKRDNVRGRVLMDDDKKLRFDMRRRLLAKAGVNCHNKSIEDVKNLNSCKLFFDLERYHFFKKFNFQRTNRLVQGSYRYGIVGDLDKPDFDRIKSVKERLDMYSGSSKDGGNIELLVDCCNLLAVEAYEGNHPNAHFETLFTDGSNKVDVK